MFDEEIKKPVIYLDCEVCDSNRLNNSLTFNYILSRF